MNIDRNNYQVWLIDLEDGKLTREQRLALEAFLDQNPDLKEEYADAGQFRLSPYSQSGFPSAAMLRKQLSQLPPGQFDLLAVAKLENDITPLEETELNELLHADPARRRSYELILKTRLIPGKEVFPGKNRMKHADPGTRIKRLAYTFISAAATILLLFSLYRLILVNEPAPGLPEGKTAGAGNNPAENRLLAEESAAKPVLPSPGKEEVVSVDVLPDAARADRSAGSEGITTGMNDSGETAASENKLTNVTNVTIPETVSFPRRIILENRIGIAGQQQLIALASSRIEVREYEEDEDRSAIGRLIARNFREKILKEDNPEESPLKAYEIAEAGVSGINRLLGWEMAISRNTDETGDVNSVYFSSRLLKVSAPVRNESPLP